MSTPSPAPLAVTFWGAAHTVTGSMHLVEHHGRKYLLDCGLFQGRRADARRINSHFPFAPRDIAAVVLSHAHIDHCGNLPNLVRQGFHGPIFCTPATADLMAVMLADSAKIQEEDAEYLNRHRPRDEPPVEPLYRAADADRTAQLARQVPYDQATEIAAGVELRFVDAGHLLGSAMVGLRFTDADRQRRITFTGDVGRRGLPILRDPAPVPPGDLLISESTYGGRTHPPVEQLADQLSDVVQRTSARGGKVLIPAFAVGRTQSVVYDLHQLVQAGRLPDLPIYVDSPLAARATDIFFRHPECFDTEAARLLQQDPDLFGQTRVRYLRTVQESKQLNGQPGTGIIIASSGMCENGRILHHLKHQIEDPRTTILIIGFQAPDTLGRRLVEKQKRVRILDRWYERRAEVVVLNGFSSHADHNDLLAFLGPLAGVAQQVRLVHGEVASAEALAAALRQTGFGDVAVPDRGERVVV